MFERSSGVFCHPTMLPGPHGIGSFGEPTRGFLDRLADADQAYWQICPLGPTAAIHGNSPYQSSSTFAIEPLLIDLEDLVSRDLLSEPATEPDPVYDADLSAETVHYEAVREFKTHRFRQAFDRFEDGDFDALEQAFSAFRRRAHWLEDYTLFRALSDVYDDRSWLEWPEPIRLREPSALERWREDLARERRYCAFLQFLAYEQWMDVREYAADRGIEILGDMPIYVALDSADVWANPACFELGDDGRPEQVAGVPPGPGDDGQKWGNPLYDWSHLESSGFDWWVDRVSWLTELVDAVRLDHFRAFESHWSIPVEKPAHEGEWRPTPGSALFDTIREAVGRVPFVAEDLGFVTDEVQTLRRSIDAPGMKVLQYADWCVDGHLYQPHTFERDTVAYPSTHDTNTVRGWYDGLGADQRDCLHYYLGTDGSAIHWDLLEAAWESDSVLAIAPIQDLYGFGSGARFNTPGTAAGNWNWRCTPEQLEAFPTERLRELTARTGRDH
ncbi:4-alpha-glucanotransferase [Natrialbaceae archaeon A-chndr2]